MVADFEEGRILGELQDLEEELEATRAGKEAERLFFTIDHKRVAAFNRVIEKLEREKERLDLRLKIHRQKIKDSGIKY